MVVRYLALVPILTTGQNNRVDFLNTREKSAPFGILDFRHRRKSGGENCAGSDQQTLLEGLRQGHSF
jgi:hypothetical protein